MALTREQMQAIYDQMGMNRQVRSFEADWYGSMTPEQLQQTLREKYNLQGAQTNQPVTQSGNTQTTSFTPSDGQPNTSYLGDGNYSTGTGSGYYVSPTQNTGGITGLPQVSASGGAASTGASTSTTTGTSGGSNFTSQLNEIYQNVLGRDVGDPGIGFYTPFLESGQLTIDQVRDDVIKNALDEIYQSELGRPLGQEGLDFYGPYLQSGDLSLDDIRQYVAADAANDTGQYTPLPSGGLATIGAPITGGATGGGDTGGTVYETAQEAIDEISDRLPDPIEQQVIDAYQKAFGRPPDQGGLEFFSNALREDSDFDLMGALVNSRENITNIDQLGEIGAPGGVPLRADGDLASIADLAYTLATGTRLEFPDYQVAGLTPEQQLAMSEFEQYRGAYKPFLSTGADTTMQGIGALGEALSGTGQLGEQIPGAIAPGLETIGEGITTLRGTGGMYSPDMIAPFMSDYEDAAVQQALADIARQGELRERDLEAEAVRAGAFGGSRQAVAEQELGRNVMEQQGRTAAEMRRQGYESAAQRSQAAFEESMRRQQQMATQAGNLGLQGANLGLAGIQAGLGAQQQQAGIGQGLGSLGQQAANMGGQAQQYQAQDLSTLMQMGQMQQGQTQAELDAQRMNAYQQMMTPFQQLAFASDIMTQTPTGITSVMSQPIQGPSLLSQIGGLVIGGAGLARVLG